MVLGNGEIGSPGHLGDDLRKHVPVDSIIIRKIEFVQPVGICIVWKAEDESQYCIRIQGSRNRTYLSQAFTRSKKEGFFELDDDEVDMVIINVILSFLVREGQIDRLSPNDEILWLNLHLHHKILYLVIHPICNIKQSNRVKSFEVT